MLRRVSPVAAPDHRVRSPQNEVAKALDFITNIKETHPNQSEADITIHHRGRDVKVVVRSHPGDSFAAIDPRDVKVDFVIEQVREFAKTAFLKQPESQQVAAFTRELNRAWTQSRVDLLDREVQPAFDPKAACCSC